MNRNINTEAKDPQNEDKCELEKKLEDVESLLNNLTDSHTEDTWNEEEMIKNERVVQFVLTPRQTIKVPDYSIEDFIQNSKHSLRRKCPKNCHLNTQTGLYITKHFKTNHISFILVIDLENHEVSLVVLPDFSTPASPTEELLALECEESFQ